MHENGAALPLNAWPVVISEYQYEIVEMVGALQTVGVAPRRELDEPIVIAVGGILAPTVMAAYRAGWKGATRAISTIGAIKHLANRKSAKRRARVAFTFQGNYARSSERDALYAMRQDHQTLAGSSRSGSDHDG
jgi:hypothetical protein